MKKRRNVSISKEEKRLLGGVGQRVRELREKKRMSVYDITGEEMPIKTRQHWQQIENGQKNMNLTTVFRVARSLEVKPEELLKGFE